MGASLHAIYVPVVAEVPKVACNGDSIAAVADQPLLLIAFSDPISVEVNYQVPRVYDSRYGCFETCSRRLQGLLGSGREAFDFPLHEISGVKKLAQREQEQLCVELCFVRVTRSHAAGGELCCLHPPLGL